ncbi:MAG: hypothetical protein LBT04_10070 [Prevotellaceae bacterium]|jgi:hypothetical protein|nr:hypothetical protein [Prevotellaceae bacterium]
MYKSNFKLGIFTPLLLIVMGMTACDAKEIQHDFSPIVFELKYGEEKTLSVNGESMTFSIIEVVDSVLVDCFLTDFISPEDMEKVRIHAFLNGEINGENNVIKISSKPCGTLQYNDSSDVEDIYNLIAEWNESSPSYCAQETVNEFGTGTAIRNDFLLHIAKAYPLLHAQTSQEDYKFIFLISNF